MGGKIVIIGAGYAGVLTAKKLEKKFRKDDSVTITLIDKNPFHTMLTELHEVAANRVDDESIRISLKKIFAGRRVNVVLDTVQSIDFEKRQVIGTNEKYAYDYLVIAAGSKPTYFGVSGAREHSFPLWSYDDAVRLRDHIHESFRKAERETNLEEKKRLLTFFIVGAGFTGVEMTGELAEYIPILCKKHEIDRELVTIVDVDILKRTVPSLPEKLSEKVERRLKKMGVTLMLETSVTSVGADFIEVKRGDKVTRYPAGTVIWAAGIESADITGEAAKALEMCGRGRIVVDRYLRSKSNDRVYVVGDNMYYIAEGSDKPVPQMVENCERSAPVAANNIYCAITGKGEMMEYKPAFHGMMVSIGGRYGVARVGTPKRMVNLPSFFAMFVKHFINIVYYMQVQGWNKVFSYIKHEFFTIRNCRSFVGGHFSNRTPSFLLVPLRIWLGMVWVFEGTMKIIEGWLASPKLSGFFGGANAWYENILNGTYEGTTGATPTADAAGKVIEAVSQATAAVSGAIEAATQATGAATGVVEAVTQATAAVSGAVEAATQATPAVQEAAKTIGTTLINFDFLGLFRMIFVSGKDLAQSTLSDYAFKLDVPIVNWIVNNWVLSSDSMQIFMQGFIVIAEILIGLALMGGLFTTLSSGFSLVLQFMFVCTTGLYLGTFWMIFAAIAVLIGGGRTFGLDYYVMPYLKGLWKKIPFVKRLYIYHD